MSDDVKIGKLIGWTEGNNATAIVQGRGETHEVTVIQPFGISVRPPNGSQIVMIPLNGSVDTLVTFCGAAASDRPSGGAGDAILYSSKQGHELRLNANGDLVYTSGGNIFSITNGKIQTNMDIVTSGDVIADGISLKNHIHGGVDSGNDETDGPQ